MYPDYHIYVSSNLLPSANDSESGPIEDLDKRKRTLEISLNDY